MTVITINGRKFARGKRGVVATLFLPGGTADGFYTTSRGVIKFFDPSGEIVAIINARGVFGAADRLPDGRIWYSHATPRVIGAFPTYSSRIEQVAQARETALK